MIAHTLPNGTIYHGRAEDMYQQIPDGAASLLISDGPYALRIADWDRMNVSDLPAFYRPHIAAWGRILAPSASVYLWNTAEGWATIHPEMVAAGWTFRTLIIWHKTGANPALISAKHASKWPNVAEYCGHYARGDYFHENDGTSNIWELSPVNDLGKERITTGFVTKKTRDLASGFQEFLHPCQKPLIFAERMIRASSRPGDLVVAPFGGTCREAVACERIAREEPAQARRYVTSEMDTDGKDYIGHVLAQIRGGDMPGRPNKQVRLFG